MEAKNAIAKGRADQDLQRRLEERRNKKLALVEAHAAKEKAITLANGMQNLSGSDTPHSAEEMLSRAKERHAELETQLERALDDEAAAQMAGLAQEIVVDHGKQSAALQEDLLNGLQNTSDEAERKMLLDAHGKKMDALLQQQEADKRRQMQELQKRMAGIWTAPAMHASARTCLLPPSRYRPSAGRRLTTRVVFLGPAMCQNEKKSGSKWSMPRWWPKSLSSLLTLPSTRRLPKSRWTCSCRCCKRARRRSRYLCR